MSPGRYAAAPGMFSAAGMRPMMLRFTPSFAMASIAPSTAAPPHLSQIIFSISAAGLMEMPPVSNVTALPTSASGACVRGPPRCSSTMSRGGRALPPPTAVMPPNFFARSCFSSNTVQRRPCFFACQRASSARVSGNTTLPGRFAMPRARFVNSPSVCACTAAFFAVATWCAPTITFTCSMARVRVVLNSSYAKSASTMPSTAAPAN